MRGAAVGGLGVVAVVVLALLMGVDPLQVLQQLPPAAPQRQGPIPAAQEQLVDFVKVVLADTEDTWHALFNASGQKYEEPTLVLFSGAVKSACGFGQAAMGPFYCPADQQVYIDLSFYGELRTKLGAPGDFAQAYVIAHEVGHHVQNLLGIADRVHAQQRRLSAEESNALSVRLELQADFFAGVWAHHADRARQVVEPDDLEEAMNAARAIGDDRLQRRSQGYVVPESFTHGTSEQRMRWFLKGYETGDPNAGDTFGATSL
jgi:hypothetical protein